MLGGIVAGTYFVGRTEHLDRILPEEGRTGEGGVIFSVNGIPGIGKTTLLEQLASRGERLGRTVVQIDGGNYPARARAAGGGADDAAEFRQFRALLREALDDLQDDNSVSVVLNYLDTSSRSGSGFIPADDRQATSWAPSNPEDIGQDVDETLEIATGATTKLAETLTARNSGLLLLVDNFHLLGGRPLGQWVTTWLAGIKGADIVLAHQKLQDDARAAMPPRAIALPLGNLAPGDVTGYLKVHPGMPDVARIEEPVWEFTAGHPQALALIADLINGKDTEESVRIIRQIGAVQGGLPSQLEELVDRILGAIDSQELRDTLCTLCVTRHFDRPLLQKLVDNVDDLRAGEIIELLRKYSFVEPAGAKRPFLAVSDFVRRFGQNRLDVDRQQEIHKRAAEYYQGCIEAESGDDEESGGEETSYDSWYRYEKPRFQALVRDWLYHLNGLEESRRQVGRIGIARIFLDAFWWWGYYVAYQFCEDILSDWSGASSNDDVDREWAKALGVLNKEYPKGWRKSVSDEQWNEVLEALLYIWYRGGFDEPMPESTDRHAEQLRHIRGILDFFLADAARFVDPHDEEADERLDDAEAQFTANDDEWDIAWVEFYRADLAVSRDQPELAMSVVTASAEAHPDLGDDELLANLHRVYADARWLLGDAAAALDAYARGVAHAYRFQVRTNPDEYTAAFQQEMVDRTIERLGALQADPRDADHAILRAAAARMHALFARYWRQVGHDPMAALGFDIVGWLADGRYGEVAAAIFPAGPTIAELNRPGTQFERTGNVVRQRMARMLADPPGTPLPADGRAAG